MTRVMTPYLFHHPGDGRAIHVEELGNLGLALLTKPNHLDRFLLLSP
jgi:hypothetical protein